MIRDEWDAVNRPDCVRTSGLPHGYFDDQITVSRWLIAGAVVLALVLVSMLFQS